MNEAWYKPIYVKAILGFILMALGLVCTFIVYRFIPVPKQPGYDGFGALMIILFCLGVIEILYILGVIFSRNHPYVVFTVCLLLFIIGLGVLRTFAV